MAKSRSNPNQAIYDAINNLAKFSQSQKAPVLDIPDYMSAVQAAMKTPQLNYLDWTDVVKDYKGSGSSKKKKKKSKKSSDFTPNIFDMISGTFGQLGGAVTNTAYNVLRDIKSDKPLWKKVMDVAADANPVGLLKRGVVGGAKEQLKDWKDGTLSWGDIPGIGFLHGMDKSWKRGEDIMSDIFGVKNRWGRVGGGLAIDIALDPLTYVTGGLGTATKLSKAAEVAKIAELSKSMGIAGKFKNADEFLNVARGVLKSKYPNMSDTIIEKRIGQLSDDIKTTRNTVFNQNINKIGLSVPFSNKMTVAVADVPKWSPTFRSEAVLGHDYKHLADDLIEKASISPMQAKTIEERVKSLYGVDDLSQLTKTQYDDLYERLQPIITKAEKGIPDAKVTRSLVEKDMPQEVFENIFKHDQVYKPQWKELQKQLDEIMEQVGHDPKLRSSIGADLAELTSKYWENQPIKNFNRVANQRKAERMAEIAKHLRDSDKLKYVESKLEELYKYGHPAAKAYNKSRDVAKALDKPFNEMLDTKTKFEHWLDRKNPFDARTLQTDDKFLNSMANTIADARSQQVGEQARYIKHLSDIQEFIKKNKMSDEEMKQAIYVLEGEAPKRLGDFKPSKNAVKLAELMKPLLKILGQDELEAGVLKAMRENYFPHVINKSDQDVEQIRQFLERHPELRGLSKGNQFSKSRKSFQTLAQLDDHIELLKQAIQKETDPIQRESLLQQLDKVQDLFDTNVLSALTRRVKEGVRARAMKSMQDELKKYGMLVSDSDSLLKHKTKGLVELSQEEAKKLGLGKGQHYIHEKVLDGLKRIDDIFTVDGLKKWQRHVMAVSDIWRSLVTHYKPSHYRNNIIGNIINNMAAGVSVGDYKAAQKLLKAYRTGEISDDQLKIIKEAYKHNVISGGFIFDMKPVFEFDEPTKLEKVAEKVREFAPARKMRSAGERIDDVFRLANFIGGVRKYGSVKKAAQQVREYLFNYNELTNMDRAMRLVVPFWNWMKRNVPLQMKILMENPKFPINVERFKELFNEDEKGQDWQKEYGIKVPGFNYYTSLPSPTADLEMLVNPRQALGSLNPMFKIPIELATNTKLFTGNPISYGSNDVKPEDIPEYLAQNFGITGNIYDAASGKKNIIEALVNLLNPISKINKVGQGGTYNGK